MATFFISSSSDPEWQSLLREMPRDENLQVPPQSPNLSPPLPVPFRDSLPPLRQETLQDASLQVRPTEEEGDVTQLSSLYRVGKGCPLLQKGVGPCGACRACISKCPRCASMAGFEACLTFPETLATQQMTDTCPRAFLGFGLSALGKEAERASGAGWPRVLDDG